MPRTRAAYPPEFRKQMLALVQAGRAPQELANGSEPRPQTIRNCVRQAEIDTGDRHDRMGVDEQREIARLRKENRQLRLE